MATKKSSNALVAAEVAAGLAAAAAAAYYFYGSTDATTHRKAALKWANKMKQEVIAEAKRLKKQNAPALAKGKKVLKKAVKKALASR